MSRADKALLAQLSRKARELRTIPKLEGFDDRKIALAVLSRDMAASIIEDFVLSFSETERKDMTDREPY